MRTSDRLIARAPAGTKYIIETRGLFVHRHIEFPDGRTVTLPKRRRRRGLALIETPSVLQESPPIQNLPQGR